MTEQRLVTLKLRQDAALSGAPTAGRGSSTLAFVPGSMLRGALAAAWIDKHGTPDTGCRRDKFVQLFESDVQFGPLFVGEPPRPLSVRVHKRNKAAATCASESDWAVDAEPLSVCGCGSDLEPSKGELAEVATKRRTHVEIGSDGTAIDKKLFSRTVVSSRGTSEFVGTVTGPSELLDELSQLDNIRVGGRTSTHGASTLSWEVTEQPSYGWPARVGRDHIVLRLASPGIFVDDFGRPQPEPNATELTSHFGDRWQIVKRWVRWGEAGGWHAASGLPKPEERCVAAGSTYLVKVNAPNAMLHTLAKSGLGLRRSEGFGVLAGGYEVAASQEEWWAQERYPYLSLAVLGAGLLARLGAELAAGESTVLELIANSPGAPGVARDAARRAVSLQPWQLAIIGEYIRGERQ